MVRLSLVKIREKIIYILHKHVYNCLYQEDKLAVTDVSITVCSVIFIMGSLLYIIYNDMIVIAQ